jgi:hypothetical protein
MQPKKLLQYIPILSSRYTATAYTPPSNLQDPLIQSPSLQATSSRRIVLRSLSESIYGSYPLYDLLSISTQSGSISASVILHSASLEDPQPACLELSSYSGSVHATLSDAFVEHRVGANSAPSSDPPPSYSTLFDTDGNSDVKHADRGIHPEQHYKDSPGNAATQFGVQAREYITSVRSQSGTISGTFPFGASTRLDSHSGSLSGVELVVVPVNASRPRQLSTVSLGGSQSVRIVEHYLWPKQEKAWWEGMVSRHESQSGSINVEYPNNWEGTIDVETRSGSVSVTGEGVEIIRMGKRGVIARKGKESSGKVVVRAGSGSVDLRFG